MNATPHVLFVGLGSPHGDDRIGWRIAEELHPRVAHWENVAARTAAVPLDLIDWLDGIERLHICDACRCDEPPGTVFRLEATPPQEGTSYLLDLQRLRGGGSHNFGLPAVLDLAARLGRLPERVIVHAVAGRCFDAGSAMSEELAARVPQIAATLLNELADAR